MCHDVPAVPVQKISGKKEKLKKSVDPIERSGDESEAVFY